MPATNSNGATRNSMSVQPGTLFRADSAAAVYRERFTPASANLQFLSFGEFEVQPGAGARAAYPSEEALLFTWRGQACVSMGGHSYALAKYDVLYVPKGESFTLANPGA